MKNLTELSFCPSTGSSVWSHRPTSLRPELTTFLDIFISMGDFQSGQMGQTVNLLSMTSVVRIHHLPPTFRRSAYKQALFIFVIFLDEILLIV